MAPDDTLDDGDRDGKGRRALKRQDTRTRLVSAARWLFEKRGYETTSMEEIARRAEVSRRTCFRYFPSKESLAFPNREEHRLRFDDLVRLADPNEPSRDVVRHVTLVMAGELMAKRDDMVTLDRLQRLNPTLRTRERDFDRHWESAIASVFSKDGDDRRARLLAGAWMGLVRAAIDLWVESEGSLNLIELAHEVLLLLDRGASARPASKGAELLPAVPRAAKETRAPRPPSKKPGSKRALHP
jgi:AcrR family transcriptional regulator